MSHLTRAAWRIPPSNRDTRKRKQGDSFHEGRLGFHSRCTAWCMQYRKPWGRPHSLASEPGKRGRRCTYSSLHDTPTRHICYSQLHWRFISWTRSVPLNGFLQLQRVLVITRSHRWEESGTPLPHLKEIKHVYIIQNHQSPNSGQAYISDLILPLGLFARKP